MAGNEYSGADMMSMQRDAIRRVREMQRRANEKIQPHPGGARQSTSFHASSQTPYVGFEQERTQAPNTSRPIKEVSSDERINPLSVLESLNLDQEKVILLLLIVLLLHEGADTKLILALCYLLI